MKLTALKYLPSGILTPAPTPTNAASMSPAQEYVNRPPIKMLAPIVAPAVGTLTPETSPLGVLSPSATTAAVSQAMNGAKRTLGPGDSLENIEEEPSIKRVRWDPAAREQSETTKDNEVKQDH